MSEHRYRLEEDDDPMLSMVNLIDVFLVVIVILFVLIIQNPLSQLMSDEDVVIIKNAGEADMEMLVKEGQKLTKYTSTGAIGEGEGVKAGVTYRLPDGSLVYVPE